MGQVIGQVITKKIWSTLDHLRRRWNPSSEAESVRYRESWLSEGRLSEYVISVPDWHVLRVKYEAVETVSE